MRRYCSSKIEILGADLSSEEKSGILKSYNVEMEMTEYEGDLVYFHDWKLH